MSSHSFADSDGESQWPDNTTSGNLDQWATLIHGAVMSDVQADIHGVYSDTLNEWMPIGARA